jgi:hypothetical protein
VYKSISHNTEKLPFVVFDKIKIDAEKNYVPVKEFEMYQLTQQ